MKEEKSKSAWQYIIIASTFFLAGVTSALLYKNSQAKKDKETATKTSKQEAQAKTSSGLESKTESSPSASPNDTWKEESLTYNNPPINTPPYQQSSKFTITESQKIYSDKSNAQTGETVNFTTTLKNTGSKKKFLTHICFNHSGGITFGCQLNINIEAGKEFPIGNSMMFSSPGTYSVWLTWSQDGTNFYKPISAGVATVRIE